jgi:c-di-AMP phosphodiesterase-like protein
VQKKKSKIIAHTLTGFRQKNNLLLKAQMIKQGIDIAELSVVKIESNVSIAQPNVLQVSKVPFQRKSNYMSKFSSRNLSNYSNMESSTPDRT